MPVFKNCPHLAGRLWLEPRFMGRLGSGVRVSDSFQMFALTAGDVFWVGKIVRAGEMSGEYV